MLVSNDTICLRIQTLRARLTVLTKVCTNADHVSKIAFFSRSCIWSRKFWSKVPLIDGPVLARRLGRLGQTYFLDQISRIWSRKFSDQIVCHSHRHSHRQSTMVPVSTLSRSIDVLLTMWLQYTIPNYCRNDPGRFYGSNWWRNSVRRDDFALEKCGHHVFIHFAWSGDQSIKKLHNQPIIITIKEGSALGRLWERHRLCFSPSRRKLLWDHFLRQTITQR